MRSDFPPRTKRGPALNGSALAQGHDCCIDEITTKRFSTAPNSVPLPARTTGFREKTASLTLSPVFPRSRTLHLSFLGLCLCLCVFFDVLCRRQASDGGVFGCSCAPGGPLSSAVDEDLGGSGGDRHRQGAAGGSAPSHPPAPTPPRPPPRPVPKARTVPDKKSIN